MGTTRGWYARERAAERITSLPRELDLVSFWHEAKAALVRAVPHHLTPCWFTLDPESRLITSHYDHGMIPEMPRDWLVHEYLEEDIQSVAGFARSEQAASTLHEATGGDPARSTRWESFIAPYGGEQELLVRLRARSGEVWGILALYREKGQPLFSDEEITFLKKLSQHLAEGAQRALLAGEAIDPDGPNAPGLLVVEADGSIGSMTPDAERWLSDLADPAGDRPLPAVVMSVAGRALRTIQGDDDPGEVAFARVLGRSGRWVTLHGAGLIGSEAHRVAIIIEPGHPMSVAPLLMAAYHLTERERDITEHVLRGASTSDIATALGISVQTVQQHLKSIFEKTGVRSRRDLVGKIFFSNYEPRLRDNERRAIEGRSLRGGPVE